MSRRRPAYRIRISKDAKKALEPGAMSPRRQKAIRRFIEDHLALKPLERIPGKTKALRGRYRGILQWDIDNSFRLHYRVNSSDRLVEILYIGPHPKW